MVHWILKTMWKQKAGIIASAFGAGFAFVLVLTLEGAFTGESNQIVAYIEKMDADVWVLQKGVSNMHMAASFIWDWKVGAVERIPGVKKATAIIYVNNVIQANQRKMFAYVIGLSPGAQRAGPWSVVSGISFPSKGEVLLPDVTRDISDINLGDKVTIADKSFIVRGFTGETFSMANSIAFITAADLEDLISASGTVSFILVDAKEGVDPNQLAETIKNNVEKVNVLTQGQFIKNDYSIAILMGVEIIFFMTIIGTILAILIIVFTNYTQVNRLRRELAIIKAIGYRNFTLYNAVIIQSVIITLLALIIAGIFVAVLVPVIRDLVPMINLDVTKSSFLRISYISIFVSLISGLIPAYFIARVDPISAFKV